MKQANQDHRPTHSRRKVIPNRPTPPTEKPQEDKRLDGGELEGEGSYTATRNYREGLEATIKRGGVEKSAEAAAAALDGPEGEELRQAEKAAKHGRAKH